MAIPANEYQNHYKAFSQNVAFSARAWHHYIYLNNRANEEKIILAALNKATRFWLDQRYIAVQTTVIFLGKIFDKDIDAHNIDKTLNALHKEKEHFSKPMLRKRKIESAGEFEGIDEYIENANELSTNDLKIISFEAKKAKAIWERIRPLRMKIYAHNQILSDVEREEIYKNVKNSDISNILQILLNISEALWQAEFNGLKPDFSIDYTRPIEHAKKDIEELIGSLITP